MIQGISDRLWQAEARTQETKQFIHEIKRITRRKFTAEGKQVLEQSKKSIRELVTEVIEEKQPN